MSALIDISPTLSSKIAVWTGDTPFSHRFLCRFADGANLDLSTIESTVHVGAHCDAPSHYHPKGVSIEQRPLDFYYGDCQIMTVCKARGERIYPEDLPTDIQAPRLLLRTLSFPNPNEFTTDFNALSPELVDFAASKGLCLIGLDTPSVDPYDSKDLESHNAIYRCDMAVLEGVILEQVADGIYTLMAFPLKIEGADAAPVRAVLKERS